MLSAGPFGHRVASLLSPRPAVAPEFPDAAFDDVAVVVAALWRPSPALTQRIDDLAWALGKPWLLIEFDHPVVRVGPFLAPPEGPCISCYRARQSQFDENHETTSAICAAFDADPARGSAAFLPHHARIAAGLAELALSGQVAGQVLTADLLAGSIRTDQVLACHGCPRCGQSDELTRVSAGLHTLFRSFAAKADADVH
ncbi:hypothetical protein Rhe02_38250 [Rhizocola hellebori]|uniref:TOMM leader peptide-binding protein n=1 Tax=Rhizocola hellebori TaxID=1392758 RepID=A0A8J3VHC0_9ACTN|nr:hypothetical protein Rhe02_38250 [Rhizocola hellebori]